MNEKLRLFLSENNINQVELARRIGTRPQHISKWIIGIKPSAKYIVKFEEVFGLSAMQTIELFGVGV